MTVATIEMSRVAYWSRFAFAVPCDEALEVLAEHAPIIELGAGTGWWAKQMRDRGTEVVAVEPDALRKRTVHAQLVVGDDRLLDRYPRRTLFLCWPTQDGRWAERALRRYRGGVLVYVGLPRAGAPGGARCATPGFFDALDANWTVEREVEIPRFEGFNDRLWVYRRGGR